MIAGIIELCLVVVLCVVGRLAWKDAREADRREALRGRPRR
jgi:hypothetical protein